VHSGDIYDNCFSCKLSHYCSWVRPWPTMHSRTVTPHINTPTLFSGRNQFSSVRFRPKLRTIACICVLVLLLVTVAWCLHGQSQLSPDSVPEIEPEHEPITTTTNPSATDLTPMPSPSPPRDVPVHTPDTIPPSTLSFPPHHTLKIDVMPRIAATLITYKRTDLLAPMLESFAASDAKRFNVTLFYWMNDYESPAAQLMRAFDKLPTVEVDNPTRDNQMIVIPHNRLVEAVMDTGEYDWALEIHDDMLFPPVWLEVCAGFGLSFAHSHAYHKKSASKNRTAPAYSLLHARAPVFFSRTHARSRCCRTWPRAATTSCSPSSGTRAS